MKLFYEYIKYHIKGIVLFFCCFILYVIIFALYHLPAGAVLYASVLCVFVALLMGGWDYRRFLKKHRQLEYLKKEIRVTGDHYPISDNQIESDYQEVIRELYDEKQQITTCMEQKYRGMMDYYTIWVHQIKTPIAAMRLQLQGEAFEQNQELLEELQRIEQYVEMVLTYLRLDAGATDYVLKDYDLDRIIKQAVRKYASQFIRKKIAIEYEPFFCKVLTDEKWLLFVMEQVISNALKYTRTGKVSITLERPKILCIRDTGIGIAPEDLPRIFDKGFTGYNGRNDKKASGIGLYLCRRICNNLGHRISVDSRVDGGTVVRIYLDRQPLEVE